MMRYIFALTRGFRLRMALSASAGIARAGLGLLFVFLSKRAVDIATGSASGNLRDYIAGLVVVLVIELIFSAVGGRATELSEAEMKNSIQEKLFSRLLTSVWTGKERFHSGDTLSRLTEDCRVISECLCRTVPTVIIALAQLIGAFLFLWHFSPALALLLMVLFPCFFFAGKAFFRRMRRLTRRIRETESRLQEVMQESLQHRLLLLTCNYTAQAVEAVSALHHSRLVFMRRRTDFTLYSRTAVIAGFELGYLAAFIWGVRGLFLKTISFGTMTAYLQLAGQIQRPLAELARLLPGLLQSHTAFSRIAEIDAAPSESDLSPGCLSDGGHPAGLSFDDVTFSYPGGVPVLRHFSHTFRPGSKTAIMGETGAGKSTLLRLALALIRPEEGAIEVFTLSGAEKSSEPVSPATRGLFMYVPQGNSLMSGTIRQNLMIGKPDATDEEMRDALHYAAADFVFDLRDGLDTVCGEHGDGLSEGQAQRIAIARGLLRPGSILLLDEISASLDEETEKTLMERLSSKRVAHTMLLVTHRSAVLPFCDATLHIPCGSFRK